MDFNKSLGSVCSFCGKAVDLAPVETVDKKCKFCDIVCAKLYYDNVEKIKINVKEYNMHYINNQLSTTAKRIYEKMNSTLFDMLPICMMTMNDDVNEVKKSYTKMISMGLGSFG